MLKKKQLIVIMFLPVCFSACNKNTYSIAVPGITAPYTKMVAGNKETAVVTNGIACTVTNF